MKCCYHPDRDSVGLCKYCQRGLCEECAALVDDVLACRDRHEQQVRNLEQLTARSLVQSRRAASAYVRNAVFYGLVGLLFAAFGALQLRFLGMQALFFMLIGSFLLYAAIANYLESRRLK
ncbi:MAG TPA: hypothetical protein VIU39_10670 [Anaerolineales bacterium]